MKFAYNLKYLCSNVYNCQYLRIQKNVIGLEMLRILMYLIFNLHFFKFFILIKFQTSRKNRVKGIPMSLYRGSPNANILAHKLYR